MSTTLTVTLSRNEDGSVNESASEAAFHAALMQHIANAETELGVISEAVNAVFDQYKGGRINMPALASLALSRLNVQPENFASLQGRVLQFVRDNAKEGGPFQIGKGKNGGVARTADLPAAK